MKQFRDLLTIVDGHNRELLADLQGHRPHLLSSSPVLAKDMASIRSTLHAGTARCYTGKVKGLIDDDVLLAKQGIDVDGLGNSVAVFSVVDEADGARPEELPVMLCVGINYGQDARYLRRLQPLQDNTGMRTNLISAFKLSGHAIPKSFHLVAANFFPWITRVNWQDLALNCLHSALLLRAFGYSDPTTHMSNLVALIDPEWLVFHGVGNSVPVLSLQMLNQFGGTRPSVLLCDNLGRPVSKNSVHLL